MPYNGPHLTYLQHKSGIKAIGGFHEEHIFSMSEALGINPAPQKKPQTTINRQNQKNQELTV